MARPVQYNIKNEGGKPVNIAEAPPGHLGEGFFTTRLSDLVGLARKILSGRFHLLLLAAVLNLWQRWGLITTWHGSVPKE